MSRSRRQGKGECNLKECNFKTVSVFFQVFFFFLQCQVKLSLLCNKQSTMFGSCGAFWLIHLPSILPQYSGWSLCGSSSLGMDSWSRVRPGVQGLPSWEGLCQIILRVWWVSVSLPFFYLCLDQISSRVFVCLLEMKSEQCVQG